MTALVQISIINFSLTASHHYYYLNKKPINSFALPRRKFTSGSKLRAKKGHTCYGKKWDFFGRGREKDWVLIKGERPKGHKREVLVRFNQGFGFNNGGGSGGGGDGNNARVIGNLVLAIGLTYLTMTGQLGWVLDAIASLWLFVVVAPIVGMGVFLWWAGRDIVQSTCPNCGNEFQVFKSMLNEELQLCPYCTQPFSVVDDKFVRDSVKFTNESTTFGDAFKDFSSSFKKGKDPSTAIVDVEAQVKDAD